MNKARRKELMNLRARIEELQSEISYIQETLCGLRDEEQEYVDNMPENLQGSERMEKAEEAVSNLEEAYTTLESMYDEAGEVADSIDAACE